MKLRPHPSLRYHQHTYAHHSYTNDHERDPDVHHLDPILRSHPELKPQPWHYLQASAAFVYPWCARAPVARSCRVLRRGRG